MLLFDVVELGEDIGLAREEHAAPVLDAGDQDLRARGGATCVRQADPEIPVRQLEQPLVEAAEPPNYVRSHEDV
jgi:hypothetical protein